MRIVADTNAIVSALVFGGVPRQVLALAEAGRCELFYSEAIQNEVRRVLTEKFGWDATSLQKALPVLWSMGELVVPRTTVRAVREDPDDDRILECALAANADFIVSGDQHLLRLRSFRSMAIVSPREFMETSVRKK
jgi:putative PIN family toxin of toxin-antitoxin system